MSKYYVIGDIGGTNLRLALIKVKIDSYELLLKQNSLTKDCNNFTRKLNASPSKISKQKEPNRFFKYWLVHFCQ